MVLDFRLCYSLYVNLPMNLENNQLINNLPEAPIESSGSPTPISWLFSCGFTLGSSLILILTFAPIKYTNKNLQRTIKLALK